MRGIELTTTSFTVLGLLATAGEATPYGLKQAAADQIGDFWSLADSHVYAELQRLARGGYVTEQRAQSRRRRRRYRATAEGTQMFADWLADPHSGAYDLRDPGLLKHALGADPAELATAQLEIHRCRLDAYEAIATRLPASARGCGRALVLEAGVGHEREYISFWSRLATPTDTST